jgi:hypothetical protein
MHFGTGVIRVDLSRLAVDHSKVSPLQSWVVLSVSLRRFSFPISAMTCDHSTLGFVASGKYAQHVAIGERSQHLRAAAYQDYEWTRRDE